jgi:hypothetical protein
MEHRKSYIRFSRCNGLQRFESQTPRRSCCCLAVAFSDRFDLILVLFVDTPEPLKIAAKRNVLLHLEKLFEDGTIEGSFVEIKSGL